ncbi:hypothetical protein LCGC14_3118970, partial [marine sediment metagenome]
ISGGYFLRQNGLESLGGINLKIRNCDGSAKGFYQVTGASGTLAPDQINAYNNELSLTEWWSDGSSTAVPDFVRITGGRYTIDTALDIPGSTNEYHWSSLVINYTATGAAFTSGGSSSNIEDITLQDIVFRVSNAGGLFCNFGSNSSSVNNGLFIKNIYGFPIAGLSITGSTTFITVDTDWTSVHVGNILAKGWTTQYTGPAAGDDHGLLQGLSDDDHTHYALLAGRSGGQTLIGDTASGGDLILQGTAHATPGDVLILSGQGFVVGHTAQIDFGAVPEFQILGTATPDSSMGFAAFSSTAAVGPDIRFLKSLGTTIGSNVLVVDGNRLGRIRFQGADGNDF